MSGSPIIRFSDFSNQKLPYTGSEYVVHSNLNHFEKPVHTSRLSVKLALSGTERYTINGRPFNLKAGEFLVVNEGDDISVAFDEKSNVEGVCFFINKTHVLQQVDLVTGRNEGLLNNGGHNKTYHDFFACKQGVRSNCFGRYVMSVAENIKETRKDTLSEDFFFAFSTKLAQHLAVTQLKVNGLKSSKLSTRQELYRRLSTCRDYIEEHASDRNITISELAVISALSEAQLHRGFKQAYGLTPHQYVLDKKMRLALSLIRQEDLSLSAIAISCGFADLPSFSKSFKARYGIPPSHYQTKN